MDAEMETAALDAVNPLAERPVADRNDRHSLAALQRSSVSAGAPRADSDDIRQVAILQRRVEQLTAQLLGAVARREQEERMFQQAMEYASAKGSANAVLRGLFDKAKAGNHAVLAEWLDTGVIPTRDGLKHWRVDLRDIRDEEGSTMLHAAVGRSMAREDAKGKIVAFLIERVGFDVDVRDLHGRTALHIAAMSNYPNVVKSLLEYGCDPTIQDRSGLTALSCVRTLSQPYEEIVRTLAAAEKASEQKLRSATESVESGRALASALFLHGLSRFVVPEQRTPFEQQTAALVHSLLDVPRDERLSFHELVRAHVPVLFSAHVPRLDKLLLPSAFSDRSFTDALRLESDGYGLSFVSQPAPVSAIAGATWTGVLRKLIQIAKSSSPAIGAAALVSSPESQQQPPPRSIETADADVDSLSDRMQRAWSLTPASPASTSSSSSSSVPPPSQAASVRASLSVSTVGDRQTWHYAVLFRASTHAFPGTLSLKKGSAVAVTSEDVGKYFPLEDRLVIGKDEYLATAYNAQTQELHLDRPFDGSDATGVKAYLSGSGSTLHPPFVKAKQILERAPGNKYEDQNSDEQELFQDYQFLHPESDYEVAAKLGPVTTAKDARALADAWKQKCREHFEAKTCISGLKACEHFCPQRSGQSLCCETMAAIGREIAKTRFGRPTFSRSLKPRAALQKYQSRFRGSDPWPGSPSTGAAVRTGATADSPAPVSFE